MRVAPHNNEPIFDCSACRPAKMLARASETRFGAVRLSSGPRDKRAASKRARARYIKLVRDPNKCARALSSRFAIGSERRARAREWFVCARARKRALLVQNCRHTVAADENERRLVLLARCRDTRRRESSSLEEEARGDQRARERSAPRKSASNCERRPRSVSITILVMRRPCAARKRRR